MANDETIFTIRVLDKKHRREAFGCGVEALDRYIRTQAGQDMRRHLAQVFVASPQGAPETIAGFYTLSAVSVAAQSMPAELAKKLPRYPLPAALLGRLAVDQAYRGVGLGQVLLADAIKRCLAAREQVAIYALIVDAKNESAKKFYQRFGFIPFLDLPNRLFLILPKSA